MILTPSIHIIVSQNSTRDLVIMSIVVCGWPMVINDNSQTICNYYAYIYCVLTFHCVATGNSLSANCYVYTQFIVVLVHTVADG